MMNSWEGLTKGCTLQGFLCYFRTECSRKKFVARRNACVFSRCSFLSSLIPPFSPPPLSLSLCLCLVVSLFLYLSTFLSISLYIYLSSSCPQPPSLFPFHTHKYFHTQTRTYARSTRDTRNVGIACRYISPLVPRRGRYIARRLRFCK